MVIAGNVFEGWTLVDLLLALVVLAVVVLASVVATLLVLHAARGLGVRAAALAADKGQSRSKAVVAGLATFVLAAGTGLYFLNRLIPLGQSGSVGATIFVVQELGRRLSTSRPTPDLADIPAPEADQSHPPHQLERVARPQDRGRSAPAAMWVGLALVAVLVSVQGYLLSITYPVIAAGIAAICVVGYFGGSRLWGWLNDEPVDPST